MLTKDVRAAVERAIVDVLGDLADEDDFSLSADDQLHELGMNSLMLARVIIQLESALEVDPFSENADSNPIADIRTVGDLSAAYERALGDRATAEA